MMSWSFALPAPGPAPSVRQRGTWPGRPAAIRFVVTCEHGGNRIPPRYRDIFHGSAALLRTHRGYDIGALAMARDLAATLDTPLFAATVSRLLVDLNRSIGHPRLYSEFTRPAAPDLRQEILAQHYRPYRDAVEACILEAIAQGHCVIHVSSHSFTPQLDGTVRNTDIGLLYDPRRRAESAFCRRWQAALRAGAPQLRTRLNYPYAGQSDGFTVYLRRRFPPGRYLGIEIEINQKHARAGARHWRQVRAAVVDALRETAASLSIDMPARYGGAA
ncbi:MAG TPA: N-formylglutamate amidohydrolase [Burkholderiaceae bacterium]|jgi:predicted N-formylglutamate amidohydrolase|nr:N-formylglutamate amidohydrolase [Burkholderiaceae bacterium]